MKKPLILLTLALALGTTANAQEGKIKFSEYDLPNGLHVILHEDHATPSVFVSLMYHVGAKNEDPSRTGFAHLFEHLMFEGSANIPRGEYFKIVQSNGGALNAYTSQDRTFYHEMMPSNQLELALWMEAERMLQAKIDTIGVNTQKGVVIEERKQTFEGQPYGTFLEELGKRAFTVHPYQWLPIGYPDHIRNSTFDEVYNFYKTYYVPNNAVLVIAGDFDEKQAKEWVAKYYAGIPKGSLPIHRPTVMEPAQTKEIRDVVYDKIQLPGVFTAYHIPATGSKEVYALNILQQILSGGNSARLKKNVDDKGIAVVSFALSLQTEHPGLFYVNAIANAGKTAEEVEAALNEQITRLQNELVSQDEFQMAMAAKEFQVAQSMTDLAGIAESLATNYTYFKDSGRINHELKFYQEITREDIQAVAKKYLSTNNRTVLYYLPESAKK